MYYLYILYSASAEKYYVGHSKDPWLRLEYHNKNDNKSFTRKRKDWKLMAVYKVGSSRSDAMQIEKYIKKQKSRKLIERMITDDPLNGKLAQLVRVLHVRD